MSASWLIGDTASVDFLVTESLAAGAATLTEDQKNELDARMMDYLKTDRLRFLIKLSADPIAAELANETQAK